MKVNSSMIYPNCISSGLYLKKEPAQIPQDSSITEKLFISDRIQGFSISAGVAVRLP